MKKNEENSDAHLALEIYKATNSDWASALSAMVEAFDAKAAVWALTFTDSGEVALCHCFGMHSSVVQRAVANHGSDPRGVSTVLPAIGYQRAHRCRDILTQEQLHASVFYRQHLRPQGVEYSLRAFLDAGGGATAIISILRDRLAGEFTIDERERMQALLPHWQTVSATERLKARELIALEVLSGPVANARVSSVLIRENRKVIFQNETAALCLGASGAGPFHLVGKRLTGRNEAVESATDELMATPPPRDIGEPCAAKNVAIGERLFRIECRPLQLFPTEACALNTRVYCLTWYRDAPMTPNLDFVAERYGLTPREKELASLLVTGSDLKSIATRLDLRITTVRTYLRSVMGKTGTRRQAELVTKVLTEAATPPAYDNPEKTGTLPRRGGR